MKSAPAPIDRIILPFQRFLRMEASGGILLLLATAVALIWANSAGGARFQEIWTTKFTIGYGDYALSKALLLWVNDGLMAIFFFVVGLEIKREILVGELKSPRQALLPIAAAVGGMAGPALIFVAFNMGHDTIRGWGVPMATDIAFAVGVLALLGKNVPLGLKVFLTALAIVDDLGAVLVIAMFYTDEIHWNAIWWAAGLLGVLVVVNRLGIRNLIVYVVIGVLMWFAVLKSGVHATIAGVLVAMTIPASIRVTRDAFPSILRASLGKLEKSTEDLGSSEVDQSVVHDLEVACEGAQSPLMRLEHALLPWVAFLIMPIFALANAGVDMGSFEAKDVFSPVAIGIAVGLFLGNQIGIVGLSLLVVKTGLATLPAGVTWRQVHGASLLAGIGFTMSLFIASLAFKGDPVLDVAKLGILMGSFLSGVVGFAVLWFACRKPAAPAPATAS